MSIYKKYCKNILKQYGKHIKIFEKRLDEPLEMKRVVKSLRKNTDLWERRIVMPYYIVRGTRHLDCYKNIKKFSKK